MPGTDDEVALYLKMGEVADAAGSLAVKLTREQQTHEAGLDAVMALAVATSSAELDMLRGGTISRAQGPFTTVMVAFDAGASSIEVLDDRTLVMLLVVSTFVSQWLAFLPEAALLEEIEMVAADDDGEAQAVLEDAKGFFGTIVPGRVEEILKQREDERD